MPAMDNKGKLSDVQAPAHDSSTAKRVNIIFYGSDLVARGLPCLSDILRTTVSMQSDDSSEQYIGLSVASNAASSVATLSKPVSLAKAIAKSNNETAENRNTIHELFALSEPPDGDIADLARRFRSPGDILLSNHTINVMPGGNKRDPSWMSQFRLASTRKQNSKKKGIENESPR